MTHTEALELIKAYVAGWNTLNKDVVLSTLADDCVVIESHGPKYQGHTEVSHWMTDWKFEGEVEYWRITTFCFDETTQVGFFEWDFACTLDGEPIAFKGASVCSFSEDKIQEIHEYRMTETSPEEV